MASCSLLRCSLSILAPKKYVMGAPPPGRGRAAALPRPMGGSASASGNPAFESIGLLRVSCSWRRRTRRRSVICASLFGVGAPEALVIGVVALLVFGPKGLAEIARNLGKTLRAFQPTIRELQDVSREFKSTLEREIGIDEVPPYSTYKPTPTDNSQQPAADPTVKPESTPYTSEELMKVTEEQIAASAAAAWSTQQPTPAQQQESAPTAQSTGTDTSGGSDDPAAPPPPAAAAATEADPDPIQANQSEKVETER